MLFSETGLGKLAGTYVADAERKVLSTHEPSHAWSLPPLDVTDCPVEQTLFFHWLHIQLINGFLTDV